MLLKINGYPVSSPFGSVDSVHTTPHSGIDFAVPEGTPLSAVGDGVITKVDITGAHDIGRMVRVDLDNGPDVLYGHLSQVNVKVGDHVSAGELIGLSGNTGHSTGPHVHIQMVADNGALIDPSSVAPFAFEPSAPSSDSFMDYVNHFADWFVSKETGIIVKPAANMWMGAAKHVIATINVYSAEIITLGIVVCAVGMMVGPILGGVNNGKWLGRLFVTFWGGVIWRMLTQ